MAKQITDSEVRTLAKSLVASYGEEFFEESTYLPWVNQMPYLEAYHQAAISLMVNGMKKPDGWRVLSEVPWGVWDSRKHKNNRRQQSHVRTDLLFLKDKFAASPGGTSWVDLLNRLGVSVELKVIVTGDWSDRWKSLCYDLWGRRYKADDPGDARQFACRFALAIIIDAGAEPVA